MIKFIHTADIHFGVENYGRVDPSTGIHSRLLDFYNAFTFVVEKAIQSDVDFFLFAGDAYKTAYPSPTQQKLFFDCLLKLFRAKIPIVIIVGNHDNSSTFGKANALELFGQMPLDGFHVISKPTSLTLNTKNGPVQIVGIPWPSKNTISLQNAYLNKSSTEITEYISEAVAFLIQDFAKKLDPSVPAILAGHLTVSSGAFSGSEKRAIYGTDPILLPTQLAIEPFDYVALGHLHKHQNLNPDPNFTPIIYSGSIERIDFGERKEEKGFCLVKIENKQKTAYEFIKTPIRKFIQIEVHLNEEDEYTEQIINEIKKEKLDGAIVKILYHIKTNKKDQVNISAIQEACNKAHYLTGIFPIRSQEIRDRRANLKATMELAQLLDAYFLTKPELYEKRTTLIEQTLKLEKELENKEL
jgi:DNA repair protein SbcD/Mre11